MRFNAKSDPAKIIHNKKSNHFISLFALEEALKLFESIHHLPSFGQLNRNNYCAEMK